PSSQPHPSSPGLQPAAQRPSSHVAPAPYSASLAHSSSAVHSWHVLSVQTYPNESPRHSAAVSQAPPVSEQLANESSTKASRARSIVFITSPAWLESTGGVVSDGAMWITEIVRVVKKDGVRRATLRA